MVVRVHEAAIALPLPEDLEGADAEGVALDPAPQGQGATIEAEAASDGVDETDGTDDATDGEDA